MFHIARPTRRERFTATTGATPETRADATPTPACPSGPAPFRSATSAPKRPPPPGRNSAAVNKSGFLLNVSPIFTPCRAKKRLTFPGASSATFRSAGLLTAKSLPKAAPGSRTSPPPKAKDSARVRSSGSSTPSVSRIGSVMRPGMSVKGFAARSTAVSGKFASPENVAWPARLLARNKSSTKESSLGFSGAGAALIPSERSMSATTSSIVSPSASSTSNRFSPTSTSNFLPMTTPLFHESVNPLLCFGNLPRQLHLRQLLV